MLIVSSKWKFNGAITIKAPFKKYNIWLNAKWLFIKKSVSSLPKWYEATKRNKKRVVAGSFSQIVITKKHKKIYLFHILLVYF